MDTTGQEFDRSDHEAHRKIRIIEQRLNILSMFVCNALAVEERERFNKLWAEAEPPPYMPQPFTPEMIERMYDVGGPYHGRPRKLLGGD